MEALALGRNPWLCERCSRDATHTVFPNANAPEVAAHVVLPVERKPRFFTSSWGHWVRVRSNSLKLYRRNGGTESVNSDLTLIRVAGIEPAILCTDGHPVLTPTPQLPAAEFTTVQHRCRARFIIV